MADSDHIDDFLLIINGVNDPIITDTYAPEALFANQLATTGWPRFCGK